MLTVDGAAGFAVWITDDGVAPPSSVALGGAAAKDLADAATPFCGLGDHRGVHLVAAESDLLDECHRRRRYITICGQIMPLSDLPTSWCEPGCEREHPYCQDCLREVARRNAEAGLAWSAASDDR